MQELFLDRSFLLECRIDHGLVSQIYQLIKKFYRRKEKNKKPEIVENITVPNLEANASDGNLVYTPRQWQKKIQAICKTLTETNNITVESIGKIRKRMDRKEHRDKISFGESDLRHFTK